MNKKWFTFFKKSRYHSTLQILNLTTMLKFKHVLSSDMTILTVNPVFPKIISYISRVKDIQDILRNDRYINVNNLSLISKEISLYDFFTENDNIFNVENSLRIFFTECKNLVLLLQEIDDNENKSFNQKKNLETCDLIISNINKLTEDLIKYLKK